MKAIAGTTFLIVTCLVSSAAGCSTGSSLDSVAGAARASSSLAHLSPTESSCSSGNEPLSDAALAVPFTGLPGTANERSFFAVKPDGLQRGLVGEIISRFERKGWKLLALKMVRPTTSLVEGHYQEHNGKAFFDNLVGYLSSNPVVAMVWEGSNVIAGGRKLLGATNPLDAEVGTIRGDFCTIVGRNLVHASDGPESAEREIALWFDSHEMCSWTRSVDPWINKNL